MQFKPEITTGNKEGHYILVKGSILQEDTAIINMYTCNNKLKIYEGKNNRNERRNKQLYNNM